ncbi:MAG: glycosyltransferase family 4 protein [Verrucomicrobiales bacterium]|nr:glycosyltransferase family 4 protein [Verrucomicrobiales bacterium]
MRILMVHNTLNDSRSVSGVLRHYGWMANEWIAAGHQTDFVAAKCGFPQLRELAPHSRLLSSDNFFDATRYFSQTWRYFAPYACRMASAHWLRLPERYDIVYASTQLIVEVYAALILARRERAKLVGKVHHVLATQVKRVGLFDRLFLWSERKTTRWLNTQADLIICGTQLVADDFHALERSLGLRESTTTQIGYGIDLAAIPYDEDRPKQFDGVLLGRLHEHKGIFELPAIWKEVVTRRPGAKLFVIGEGPHRPRMEAMFAECGLRDAVTFTGGISEARKNELLAQARIGLSLSFEEGWGLSINEFLGAGLPVVAYDLPIFAQVFPGQLDLVQAGDREGAAAKILAFLKDEPRRREQGRRGRNFVARYDYRKVARAELQALIAMFQTGYE